eukprot:TRINITY_DN4015_c0_g2_i1.p1 TRINITY_DN4015_c0_g2~~TRINITY_DN4015_c0_g2_i1.p1  ORF type:complete len:113 (-),score=2.09 TRINITY_DN4015_c0_g2_i1:316-654(-)
MRRGERDGGGSAPLRSVHTAVHRQIHLGTSSEGRGSPSQIQTYRATYEGEIAAAPESTLDMELLMQDFPQLLERVKFIEPHFLSEDIEPEHEVSSTPLGTAQGEHGGGVSSG